MLIIKAKATHKVQAAMKITVNLKRILNLIVVRKKMKVLMIEVRQIRKKLRRKRRLKKQGLPKKKKF